METDRETGWAENTRKSRRTQAQRSRIRERAHHAGTGDGKKRRGQIIFFSVSHAYTHRRMRTNMHAHRGIKNKKK